MSKYAALKKIKKNQEKVASEPQRTGPRKQIYSILLACLTTTISVFITKTAVPHVQESTQDEEYVLLDQPHWEVGTMAFIEFVNPRIDEEKGGFAFFVKTPYVSSFDITSFDNHKFSLDADRTKNVYSSDDDLQFPALLVMNKGPASQISSPIKLKVRGVYKDEVGIGFRLQGASSQAQNTLQEMVSAIRQNPDAKITLIFDFMDSFSVMEKHLGIISNRGKMSLDGDDVVYEAPLKSSKDVFNDKDTLMYGLGEQSMEYIFNDHPDYRREQKILSDHDLSNQTRLGAIMAEVNAYAPKILILGAKAPLGGTLSNLEIKDGVLRIRFQNNHAVPRAVLNGKISPTIVLDFKVPKHLQDEYLVASQLQEDGEKSGMDFDYELSQDEYKKKIFIQFATRKYKYLGKGDYATTQIANDNFDALFIEDMFERNIYKPDDGVFTAKIPFDFTALIVLKRNGKLSLKCCYEHNNVVKNASHLNIDTGDLKDVYREKGADRLVSIKGEETYLVWSWLKTGTFSGLHGEKGVLYKKEDVFFFDILVKKGKNGAYDDANTLGFYHNLEKAQYYAFSDFRTGWGVWDMQDIKQIKGEKDLFAKDHVISGVFDFINSYSNKAVIIINQNSYLVRLHQVAAGENYIRFKLSFLNEEDQKHAIQKGRFTILFEE